MDTMEEAAPPLPARSHNLWTVAWIVYGTLALLFVSMPNQVASRLDDLPSTSVVRGVQQATLAVAKGSDAVGIETFYRALRARFLAAAAIGGG